MKRNVIHFWRPFELTLHLSCHFFSSVFKFNIHHPRILYTDKNIEKKFHQQQQQQQSKGPIHNSGVNDLKLISIMKYLNRAIQTIFIAGIQRV